MAPQRVEPGVQGRFQQPLGPVLGHIFIFKVQSIDLTFADFKCLGMTYAGTHDRILKNNSSDPKVPNLPGYHEEVCHPDQRFPDSQQSDCQIPDLAFDASFKYGRPLLAPRLVD